MAKAREVSSLVIKMQRRKSLEKVVQKELQWQRDGIWRVRTKCQWGRVDV